LGKPKGGRREGAGRPANTLDVAPHDDPEQFLVAVMNSAGASARARIDAARALMPFRHAKRGELGKKDQRQAAAEKAGKGRFNPSKPPKLAVVGGTEKAA
jgi:phage terminase small subunit